MRWMTTVVILMVAALAGAEDRALLVGVGDYQWECPAGCRCSPDCDRSETCCCCNPDLPGITHDIELMKGFVNEMGIADTGIKVLKDRAANQAGVMEAIQSWLVDGVKRGDRAVFYFSGHGTRVPDKNGDEPDGSDEVLVPWDFVPASMNPVTKERIEIQNVILDDDLSRLLSKIPSRQTFVFIDACNSGTISKGGIGFETKGAIAGVGPGFPKTWVYPGMPSGSGGFADAVVEQARAKGAGGGGGALPFVCLSAAQDDEFAQASQNGSFFTLALRDTIRSYRESGEALTPRILNKEAQERIARFCTENHRRVHTPSLTGNENLKGISIFSRCDGGNELWTTLEGLLTFTEAPLEVEGLRSEYTTGELLEMTISVPDNGYLYVFNIGECDDEVTVLFPNRMQDTNDVRRGERIEFPPRGGDGKRAFNLPTRLGEGVARERNLLVAVVSPRRVELEQERAGNSLFQVFGAAQKSSWEPEAPGEVVIAAFGKVIDAVRAK